MIIISRFFIFLLVLIPGLANSAPLDPLPVPDPSVYKDFLLEEWKPGKPTLVAFKDPFCPYCITALEKRNQLSKYNVFLFWSPILGDDSATRVNDFFSCESPTSTDVLDAMIKRIKPLCSGQFKDKLFQLNKKIVASYRLNSVPQYWLGGRQIAFSRLNLDKNSVDAVSIAESSPIKINWSRYQYSSVNQSSGKRFSVGVVLPAGYRVTSGLMKALAKNSHYNWYIFGDSINEKNHAQFWCARNVGQCSGDQYSNYKKNSEEFKLLTGLDNIVKPKFIFEGKELIKQEKYYLIPRNILAMLSSK